MTSKNYNTFEESVHHEKTEHVTNILKGHKGTEIRNQTKLKPKKTYYHT